MVAHFNAMAGAALPQSCLFYFSQSITGGIQKRSCWERQSGRGGGRFVVSAAKHA